MRETPALLARRIGHHAACCIDVPPLLTFGAPVPVDGEYEDAFRRQVQAVADYSEDL